MPIRLEISTAERARRWRLRLCITCGKPLERRSILADESYCSINHARLDDSRTSKASARNRAERRAHEVKRFCHACGERITPERLIRYPTTKTCSSVCSKAYQTAQASGASRRYQRRRAQEFNREKATALAADPRPCVVCPRTIPIERRIQWPSVRTCSPACGDIHHKQQEREARKRYRARRRQMVK